jgi:hypothetical protein
MKEDRMEDVLSHEEKHLAKSTQSRVCNRQVHSSQGFTSIYLYEVL